MLKLWHFLQGLWVRICGDWHDSYASCRFQHIRFCQIWSIQFYWFFSIWSSKEVFVAQIASWIRLWFNLFSLSYGLQGYENILNNYEGIVFVQCFFKHCCNQRDHATKQNHLHKNSSCVKKNNLWTLMSCSIVCSTFGSYQVG